MPLFSPGLRYFEYVARFGSIQEAARQMHIAASAVNRQVLKLEDELGTELFERTPRGMRLTIAGQALVVDVRRWLVEAERTRGTIDAVRGLRAGHVRIATMECLAQEFLPPILAGFRSRHPAVSFEIHVHGTAQCMEILDAGGVDLALAFDPPTSLARREVWSRSWPLGAIVRASHPLARLGAVRPIDCAPFDIVMPSGALALAEKLGPIVARMGESRPPLLISNSVAAIKGMLLECDAIGFLTPIDVLTERRNGRLTFLPLEMREGSTDRLVLARSRGGGSSPAADAIAQELAGRLEELRA